ACRIDERVAAPRPESSRGALSLSAPLEDSGRGATPSARFRPPRPAAALAPLVGLAHHALAPQRAGGAVRVRLEAEVAGQAADVLAEHRPAGLGHLVLQAGAGGLGVVGLDIEQAEPPADQQ